MRRPAGDLFAVDPVERWRAIFAFPPLSLPLCNGSRKLNDPIERSTMRPWVVLLLMIGPTEGPPPGRRPPPKQAKRPRPPQKPWSSIRNDLNFTTSEEEEDVLHLGTKNATRLPEILAVSCTESKSYTRRDLGACVWSQTTCHPFALDKLKIECRPNQCLEPCRSVEEAVQRYPPLRPHCRVPLACPGGNIAAPGLKKATQLCGFDDMARSAFDVRNGGRGSLWAGGTYERSFYVYGFGGAKNRCEFYHVWVAVARYFALVFEEFRRPARTIRDLAATYPSGERIVFYVNNAFAGDFRKCDHVMKLFRALSPRLVLLPPKKPPCFKNSILGLPKTWLGNWSPLPWRPVSKSFVQTFEAMRYIMLQRILGWSHDDIADNDATGARICSGGKKLRLMLVQRSASRSIQNANLIVEAARSAGFDVIIGDHTGDVKAQLSRVASLDAMIGRHGAGLVWTPMLRPHGVLVEMIANGTSGGEYFAKWDNRDPHYTLYANWAIGTGKSHILWESKRPAPSENKNKRLGSDWKWGQFVVSDANEAAALINRVKAAILASAGCPNASMPLLVGHWRLGTNPDLIPHLTASGVPVDLPPYANCSSPPCGWRKNK